MKALAALSLRIEFFGWVHGGKFAMKSIFSFMKHSMNKFIAFHTGQYDDNFLRVSIFSIIDEGIEAITSIFIPQYLAIVEESHLPSVHSILWK